MCSVSLNPELFLGRGLSVGSLCSLPEVVSFWRGIMFDSARHPRNLLTRNHFYVDSVACRFLDQSGRVHSKPKACSY